MALPCTVLMLFSTYYIVAHRQSLIDDVSGLFYSKSKREALFEISKIEAAEAIFRAELKEIAEKYIKWKEVGGDVDLTLKKSIMELHMDLDFFFNKIDEIVSGDDEYVRQRRKELVDQFGSHAALVDEMLSGILEKE